MSIFSNISGSVVRRWGCRILNSSKAVVSSPSIVVSVPRWAGTSKSSSGKEIMQESDFMILLFRSSGVVTLNTYFDPRACICPAFCISELENPEQSETPSGTRKYRSEGMRMTLE